jgi:hypothetical protein
MVRFNSNNDNIDEWGCEVPFRRLDGLIARSRNMVRFRTNADKVASCIRHETDRPTL